MLILMATSDSERSQRLAHQIGAAFDGSEYPGDDNLVYDNSPRHLACADVRSKFSGLNWDVVPDDLIDDTGQDFYFMTPAAERYYLPTHMMAALNHPDRLWTLHADLISLLSSADIAKRFAQLTSAQKVAIADFIRYSLERFADDLPDPKATTLALDNFWSPTGRP